MTNFSIVAQIIVALSIIYVWIFRFDNIVKEFNQYGLSDLTRSIVGATKIALSTLLVAGIWYPSLILIPSLLMAFLMLSAQYFHFKAGNPWQKRIPSLLLLILCLFIAAVSQKLVQQCKTKQPAIETIIKIITLTGKPVTETFIKNNPTSDNPNIRFHPLNVLEDYISLDYLPDELSGFIYYPCRMNKKNYE